MILAGIASAQKITWQKWFDYNNYDNSGQDVIQTFDGGYIILGVNYRTLNYSSILIKTNEYGTVEWQSIIDQTVANGAQIECYSIQQTPDSGFVLCGAQHNNDSAVLLKTDKFGIIQWIRNYTRPGMEAQFFNHKITLDGGIIACGGLFPPFKTYLVKTDSIGNIQWDSSYNLVSNKILQSDDGNFYILSTNSISKIDIAGRIIWTKGIGGKNMIQLNTSVMST